MDINQRFSVVLELSKKNDARLQQEEEKLIIETTLYLDSLLLRYEKDKGIRENIIQCVCFKVFIKKKYRNIREVEKFDHWIYRVAINEANKYFEQRKRYRDLIVLVERDNRSEEADPSLESEHKEELENLEKAVKKIFFENFSRNERICFKEKYKKGLRNVEIAALLNISPSQVGVHIYRACKKLRENPQIRRYLC